MALKSTRSKLTFGTSSLPYGTDFWNAARWHERLLLDWVSGQVGECLVSFFEVSFSSMLTKKKRTTVPSKIKTFMAFTTVHDPLCYTCS